MDLFEYQGKQFFARYGMPVSDGEVAFTTDEAVAAAKRLGTPVMVKAQVHTGGEARPEASSSLPRSTTCVPTPTPSWALISTAT